MVMTGPTITELDERITIIRANINELVEQATAYSGAADENRTADRIAEQEQELAKLMKLRDALLRRYALRQRLAQLPDMPWSVSKQLVARLGRAACHTLHLPARFRPLLANDSFADFLHAAISPPMYSEWLCAPNEGRWQYDQSNHGSNALALGNHRA